MKKKRQSEPCGDVDNESTESCEDNQNKITCKHSIKSVDLSKVKKALLKGGLHSDCAECLSHNTPNSPDTVEDAAEYDLRLWLCLKCGNQGCGRLRRKHALQHFNQPHSDPHSLCIDTTEWSVWCYECDRDLPPNNRPKKLLEACDFIKKQSGLNVLKVRPAMDVKVVEPIPTTPLSPSENNVEESSVVVNLPRVRGLSNLGKKICI